jgi:hypothetical protein
MKYIWKIYNLHCSQLHGKINGGNNKITVRIIHNVLGLMLIPGIRNSACWNTHTHTYPKCYKLFFGRHKGSTNPEDTFEPSLGWVVSSFIF